MKKSIVLLIVLLTFCKNACAQGLTATLQSGDQLSVYYGVNAFVSAYEAAKDGDVITLSAGTFNAPTVVEKSLRITGVGAFEETGNTVIASLYVTGSNIRIEGVKFSSKFFPSKSTNLIMVRCWIQSLEATANFSNPLFSECVFPGYLKNMKYAMNFTIKNSTIENLGDGNANKTNIGNVINSVIYSWTNLTNYYLYAIYKNCCIGYDAGYSSKKISCSSPSEFYNNVAFSTNDNYEATFSFGGDCINVGNQSMTWAELFNSTRSIPAQPQNAPNGDDGTPVGPYGGTGFSPYPAIPRIVSKKIDGSTNDEGKINVKIELKAE